MILAYIPEIQNEFGELRPGIVHRLDKDTSGVLAVAKNSFSLRRLGNQFKHKRVKRLYQALVVGRNIEPEGTVQSYLARSLSDRKKFASVRNERGQVLREEGLELASGKWAKTYYRVLQSKGYIHALELRLETGRTHQIRVHMSELGHAVWADPVYGKSVGSLVSTKEKAGLEKIKRLALHARSLSIFHPRTDVPLDFEVSWPEEVRAGLEELGISVFL
jgi:23S rRNA pseudouridine1911/1915/1917 synthase